MSKCDKRSLFSIVSYKPHGLGKYIGIVFYKRHDLEKYLTNLTIDTVLGNIDTKLVDLRQCKCHWFSRLFPASFQNLERMFWWEVRWRGSWWWLRVESVLADRTKTNWMSTGWRSLHLHGGGRSETSEKCYPCCGWSLRHTSIPKKAFYGRNQWGPREIGEVSFNWCDRSITKINIPNSLRRMYLWWCLQ